jgi:hypothetical protein
MSDKKKGKAKKIKKPKNKVGRPTDYRDEYCERMIEYFKSPKRKIIYDIEKFQNGELKRKKPIAFAPQLPTIQRFAIFELGVAPSTLYKWEEVHPEFHEICEIARELEKMHLAEGGLNKDYDASFEKFLLMARWPEEYKNGEDPPEGQKLEINVTYGKDEKPAKTTEESQT